MDAPPGPLPESKPANGNPHFRGCIRPSTAITLLLHPIIGASRFHAASWAGLCPKNDESAGKRRSTRMRKGAPWLKTTLIQCSWAAARKKGSYIQAQFHRIRSRRGVKKAIGAVAASILTAIYHMLKNGTCYQDLGPDHFDRRAKTTKTKHLVARLQHLGYAVQITPLAA
jgi:transposase